MQVLRVAAFSFLLTYWAKADSGTDALSQAQQHFRNVLADQVQKLEQTKTSVFTGEHGWLCLTGNLRLLAAEKFWGDTASKVGRSRDPKWADPIPAIVDFQQQLEKRGIKLLLVPIPPKAAIYAEEIFPGVDLKGSDPAPFLHRFYDELRGQGVDVLDLTSTFLANRATEHGSLFCKSDSHWSGIGCVLAAQAITQKIRDTSASTQPPREELNSEWKKVLIEGDLQKLLRQSQQSTAGEEISVRMVSGKNGVPIAPDPNSPVLLLGDSHVLVFHDFLAERAGLLDQLALELGFAPDVIGTRGSAATAVRINLYRHNLSDPGYLAKKKVVVWCFAAREFTATEQGWMLEPVAK
jgi:acetyltransferase AlgX (SGNH hydrolase-like protein)